MKKLSIYFLSFMILVGCNNDMETEGISRITYYPDFDLEGKETYVIEENEPFTDPGIEVTEQGQPIPFNSVYLGRYTGYSGSTIGSEVDQYNLIYDAVNRDGFEGSATRVIARVHTGDFVSNIEGAYWATSLRVSGEGYENFMVLVTEVAPNVFEVTDALGGFYTEGRALGDDYLVTGLKITLQNLPAGLYTYEDDVERADGIPMEVSELEIDTEGKTISFRTTTSEFASGDWAITLTQIQD